MRFTIFAAVMIACLGVASAQQTLTNSSIVQMVKAGLSESVVVDAIHTQPHRFSLSTPDLIALKQAGVSDAILAAMLTAAAPQPAPSVMPTPAIKSIRDVHTILIEGNNEAASNARNDLLKIASKYSKRACFTLTGVRQSADAILEISESDTAGGSGGIFGGTNLETTVASGTLTDAAGDLLWSNSKQGMQGIFHTGAGDAAQNLLMPLYIAAGCDSYGLRQKSESAASQAAPANTQNITWVRKLYLTGSKERAIKSAPRYLKRFTCLQPVKTPEEAQAVVLLTQSIDLPEERGLLTHRVRKAPLSHMYSLATLESKNGKTTLWSYDESSELTQGQSNEGSWWEALNKAVGCGKAALGSWTTRKNWPPPTPEPTALSETAQNSSHKESKWPAAQAKP